MTMEMATSSWHTVEHSRVQYDYEYEERMMKELEGAHRNDVVP